MSAVAVVKVKVASHRVKVAGPGRVAVGQAEYTSGAMLVAVKAAVEAGGGCCASSHAYAVELGAAKCFGDRVYGLWCERWAEVTGDPWCSLLAMGLADGAKYGTDTIRQWAEAQPADSAAANCLIRVDQGIADRLAAKALADEAKAERQAMRAAEAAVKAKAAKAAATKAARAAKAAQPAKAAPKAAGGRKASTHPAKAGTTTTRARKAATTTKAAA